MIHSKRTAAIAAVAVAATCCGPMPPTSRDPDWIRFDPVMQIVDKPMPTIWIAPKHIPITGQFHYLIVFEQAKFQEVVRRAADICTSAKGPHPLDTWYRYYAIAKSVDGVARPGCTLSQAETCTAVRTFYELGLEPGFDKLSEAFEPLLMRTGCFIGRAKF